MHGEFLEIPGARLHYEVEGSGPPLFLIHAGVANLRQWDPHAPAWAEHYRVIRYDTRGWGESESEHVEFSNRDDVTALLDHLGEPQAHILGTSRGGMIAMDFAVTHPERVLSLVEVAGGVGGYEPEVRPEDAALGEALWKASEAAEESKDWARLAELEADYWVDGPGQPQGRADPAVKALVDRWILESYEAETESGIPQPLDPPAIAYLDQLTAPVLAIYGELDEAETNASMRWLGEQPGNRLEVFRSAAHMLNLEQPARFTDLVLEFLAGV